MTFRAVLCDSAVPASFSTTRPHRGTVIRGRHFGTRAFNILSSSQGCVMKLDLTHK